MKLFEINEVFTKKVANYIAEGWVINPKSMSGHQGELAKIDLVKGSKLMRIWLNDERLHRTSEDWWYNDAIVLRVGIWNRPASDADSWTVWMNEFDEILEEIVYYVVEANKWYAEDLEEFNRIREIQVARRKMLYRYPSNDYVKLTSEKAMEIARKFMRLRKGYQRISDSRLSIAKSTRKGSQGSETVYKITYGSDSYILRNW